MKTWRPFRAPKQAKQLTHGQPNPRGSRSSYPQIRPAILATTRTRHSNHLLSMPFRMLPVPSLARRSQRHSCILGCILSAHNFHTTMLLLKPYATLSSSKDLTVNLDTRIHDLLHTKPRSSHQQLLSPQFPPRHLQQQAHHLAEYSTVKNHVIPTSQPSCLEPALIKPVSEKIWLPHNHNSCHRKTTRMVASSSCSASCCSSGHHLAFQR